MLAVHELGNASSRHSVSLTVDSTVAQIVAAIRRSADTHARLYVSWKWPGDAAAAGARARRLRGEDRPLHVVRQLQRACESDVLLIVANVEDEPSFASHGLKLETGESDLFALIERMGKGDACAYLVTSIDGGPWAKLWWVLVGDRLWHSQRSFDDVIHLVPLAHGVVSQGPADNTLEMQGALHTYRLQAASKADASAWTAALRSRAQTATENDLVAVADIILADEELAATRTQRALIERATASFEGLVETNAGARLLAKFARRLGTQLEGLLWFYLDARHIDLTGDVAGALQRFCDLRGPALANLKAEVRHVSSPSLALLSRVLIDVRALLIEQLYDKFTASDLAVAELPLANLLER